MKSLLIDTSSSNVVVSIIDDDKKLNQIRESIKKFAKPDAAEKICKKILV